jgi:predicted nucleic-acid-binding Zn-ribbon protein
MTCQDSNSFDREKPGANPTTSECTYNYNASDVVSLSVVFKVDYNIFVFKTHTVTCGDVNFYNSSVVTHDRKIFPWTKKTDFRTDL